YEKIKYSVRVFILEFSAGSSQYCVKPVDAIADRALAGCELFDRLFNNGVAAGMPEHVGLAPTAISRRPTVVLMIRIDTMATSLRFRKGTSWKAGSLAGPHWSAGPAKE